MQSANALGSREVRLTTAAGSCARTPLSPEAMSDRQQRTKLQTKEPRLECWRFRSVMMVRSEEILVRKGGFEPFPNPPQLFESLQAKGHCFRPQTHLGFRFCSNLLIDPFPQR